MKRHIVISCLLLLVQAQGHAQQPSTDTRPGIAPDVREDDSRFKLQRGDFVAVPIPISNPTLETGLVVGAAYFYPQTEAQARAQPASLTAAAGLYTSNDSRAAVLAQQNYWKEDRWRFTGALGSADLRLSLLSAGSGSGTESLDWRVKGHFVFTKLARRLTGDWYGGMQFRWVDAEQSLVTSTKSTDLDTAGKIHSVGMGFLVEHDTRDMPTNAYSGHYFKVDTLFNDEALGSKNTYQSYSTFFRSYHRLNDDWVAALDLRGCNRQGRIPLWDACRIGLRGFSATDYLGTSSVSAQLEARWQLSQRWGLVGFGGAGRIGNSFGDVREHNSIPSVGAGVRFMVLPAKRINVRIDFAHSIDDKAVHLSVGEAF